MSIIGCWRLSENRSIYLEINSEGSLQGRIHTLQKSYEISSYDILGLPKDLQTQSKKCLEVYLKHCWVEIVTFGNGEHGLRVNPRLLGGMLLAIPATSALVAKGIATAKVIGTFIVAKFPIGAASSATFHIIKTPMNELSFADTAKAALRGGTRSVITGGLAPLVGTCAEATGVVDIAKQILDTPAGKVILEVIDKNPKIAEASLQATINLSNEVVNDAFTGEISGKTVLKATAQSIIGAGFDQTKFADDVRQGFADACTQVADNLLEGKPIIEGTLRAYVGGSVTTVAMSEAEKKANRKMKITKENPETRTQAIAKAAMHGSIQGGTHRILNKIENIDASLNDSSKIDNIDASLNNSSKIDIPSETQAIYNILSKYEKEFGWRQSRIEQFCKSLTLLKEGEYRMVPARFTKAAPGESHSIYMLNVRKQGGSLIFRFDPVSVLKASL